jgi:hypothetical protein
LTLNVDGLVARVYSVDTGKPVGPPLRHKDRPREVYMVISQWDFSPDGKLVAIGLGDEKYKGLDDTAGYIRVWEVATGKEVKLSKYCDIGRVTGLHFRDNRRLKVHCLGISGK